MPNGTYGGVRGARVIPYSIEFRLRFAKQKDSDIMNINNPKEELQ